MPTLTRWHIKTGVVCLVASLVIGALLASRSMWTLPDIVAGFGPIYFHLFMVGWVLQLIFGIIYWLFPRYSKESARGPESLAWATFILLNSGLLLRVVGEPLNAVYPRPLWGWFLVISATLQWLAGITFVIGTWPRVHGGPRRND